MREECGTHSWGSESHDNLRLTTPRTRENYMSSRALGPQLVAIGVPDSGMSGKMETTLNGIPRSAKG
jgi:hypothetical protein